MPFNPLPTDFTNFLTQLDPARDCILELGVGDGAFRHLINPKHKTYIGLDRRGPRAGTVCNLMGDARYPPISPGSVTVLLVANLVRHLVPRRRLGQHVAVWRDLLAPGGRLFIFEDEPDAGASAGRNFRDLQAILAGLMPTSRGALMSCSRFQSLAVPDEDLSDWKFGSSRNESVIDASEVMRFLTAGLGTPHGPVVGLIRNIGRHGIAPMRYWWGEVGPRER